MILVKNKTKDEELVKKILKHLKSIDRNISWLSRNTEIPYPTLHSIFKQKDFSLGEVRLKKINKLLNTDFKL